MHEAKVVQRLVAHIVVTLLLLFFISFSHSQIVEFRNDNYLYSFTSNHNWFGGRTSCQNWRPGADAIWIESSSEFSFIRNIQKYYNDGSYWLGMRDLSENEFKWVYDGTWPSVTWWREGEPNRMHENGETEACVEYTVDRVDWNDAHCSLGRRMICKVEIQCNNIKKSSTSTVCSGGRGTCTDWDVCKCSDYTKHTGQFCENSYCGGVLSTSESVCSGRGSCVNYNTCNCNSPYSGANCELWKCNNVLKNDANVCGGHGTCTAPETCVCTGNYTSTYCNEPICSGVRATDPSVCSGEGTCTAANTCNCNSTHSGDVCQDHRCFGVDFYNSTVCSGHGDCLGVDQCNCSPGYTGANCEISICGDFLSNDTLNVCSGRGSCDSASNCTCDTGYGGPICEYTYCYDILSNETSLVCSGRGNCSTPNNCTCATYYHGHECQIRDCFGVLSNETHVCSGHGACLALDTCVCNMSYGGLNCEFSECFGILSNETSLVCSNGHGNCTAPNQCECFPNSLSDQCEIHVCFGYLSNDTRVCSDSNGTCISPDVCVCNDAYVGAACEQFTCYGLLPGDTVNRTCSNRGSCVGADRCACWDHYEGDICNITSCFGFSTLNSETRHGICSSHGNCTDYNICQCEEGYTGPNCQFPICFGVSSDSARVCSGHGQCVEPDVCSCITSDYGGERCNDFTCFGIVNLDASVCNSKGNCTNANECECISTAYGSSCEFHNCFGKINVDTSVCSGHGACQMHDQCACVEGYSGSECELFTCDELVLQSTLNSTCGGHGTCVDHNKCQCDGNWNGANCDVCKHGWVGENCTQKACDCMGRGVCQEDYTCKCAVSFTNASYCRECADNYFGDRCEVFCNAESSCTGHGTCSYSGCNCFDSDQKGHFDGISCSLCKAGWLGATCAVKFETEWQFSSDGDRIVGVFFHPTPLWQIDCASLIPSASERAKLGQGASCRWRDAQHTGGVFEISFGSSPTLMPKEILDMDFFLGSSSETGSAKRKVIVRAPSVVSAPTAVVNGHEKIGGCSSLRLDASMSSSKDRRELAYTWDLVSENTNDSSLRQFLSTQQGMQFVVDPSLMIVNETYHVRLNVTTFLGGVASALHPVTITLDTIPLALISGKRVVEAFASDVVTIDGRMEEAPCLPASFVDFFWNQTSGTKLLFRTASNGRRLILKGVFPPEAAEYEFEFITSIKSNPALRSSAKVLLTLKPTPLQLRIAGGVKQQVRANVATTLNTVLTGYNQSQVSFQWMCTSTITNGLCPNWNQVSTSDASLALPAGTLPEGKWKISATARRSPQVATASVELEVVAALIPRISFEPHPALINRQDRLILPSKLGLETPENTVTYAWKAVENGRELSLSELQSIAFTPLSNKVLGVKANALTEGSTYEFTITGMASDGVSGYSVTSILVNESPRPGTFRVSPEVGEMLSTEFSIECTNWIDADTPLTYSMRYKDPTTQKENALVFSTSNNIFSTNIPVPGLVSTNHTLTLVLYVTDRRGASTRVEKEVKVTPLSSNPSTFATAVQSSFSKQQDKLMTMNKVEKLSTVTMYAAAMNTGDESMMNATRSVRGSLFNLLNQTIEEDDGTPVTTESIAQQVDMISKLSSDTAGLTADQRSLSTSVLSSSVSSSQLSAEGATDLASGLSNLITSAISTNSIQSTLNETKQYFDIAGALTNNLMSRQIVGQEINQIDTPQLSVATLKKSPADLESALEIGGTSIQIPSGVVSASNDTSEGVGIKVAVSSEGSDLKIEGLRNAIILDIPGTFNSSEYEWDLTKAGVRPLCRFWNTSSNTWDGEGGTFLELVHNNVTNTTFARCAFTHTTDFGSVVQYAMPSINVPDVTRITELNTDNMTALIVICSFLLVYVILMVLLEVLSWIRPLILNKKLSAAELKHSLRSGVKDSPSRTMLDNFKQAHIWLAFLFPPRLGKTNFTRSVMLTLVMVTIVGILVSNALTFGRTQANFAQVITAAVFSDMASVPFIVGFTVLFGLVKKRKRNKKKDVPLLSQDELENPFSDDLMNDSVKTFVTFHKKKEDVCKSNPWDALDSNIERTVQQRVENPSLYSHENNINDVVTPVVQALIVDEENDYRNAVEGYSTLSVFEKRFDILMDAIDEMFYRFDRWQKSKRKNSGVSKLSLLIFGIASLAYFALLGVVDYCLITTVDWLGERGAIIITTLGIVAYIGGCVSFFLYSKYKFTSSLSEKANAQSTSKAVLIIVTLSGVLIGLSILIMAALAVLYFANRWAWLQLDYYIVLNVGALLVIVLSFCLAVFSLYVPHGKKKDKKEKKQKVQKSKEPGLFPWWSRYVIYLLCWVYILAFSFLIVVYGIQFDSVSKGAAGNWILSSFLGLGQNVLLNKPVVFLVKTVVLTTVSSLFSELASSGFDIDIGLDVDMDL